MYCTEAEMMKNQLPLGYRDYCAHALIPLNRCRVANLYLPWTCQNQKHAYEKCQYEEYVRCWTRAGTGGGEGRRLGDAPTGERGLAAMLRLSWRWAETIGQNDGG
jgi:hypothetical protein